MSTPAAEATSKLVRPSRDFCYATYFDEHGLLFQCGCSRCESGRPLPRKPPSEGGRTIPIYEIDALIEKVRKERELGD